MKFFLLFVFIVASSASMAQKLKLTIGPEITIQELLNEMEVSKWKTVRKPEAVPDGQFFDLASRRTFLKYSFSAQFMSFENFIEPTQPRSFQSESNTESERVNILQLLNHRGKLFVFYTAKTENDDKPVYVQEVTKDLVVLGSPILVAKIINSKEWAATLTFRRSANNKYFVIYREMFTGGKNPYQFECTVINSEFGHVWFKQVMLKEKNNAIELQSIRVDDNGNVYGLFHHLVDDEKQPIVFHIDASSQTFTSTTPGLSEGTNYGVRLEVIQGKQAYVVGLNRKKKDVKCFVSSIDGTNGTLTNLCTLPVPAVNDHIHIGGNINPVYWAVHNVVGLNNGNLVLSCEANYLVTSSGRTDYVSAHTYVLSVTATGSKVYEHTVFKGQKLSDARFLGHTLLAQKDKVFVLYNDMESNQKVPPGSNRVTAFYGKNPAILVQEIDANGKATKYALSKNQALESFYLIKDTVEKLEEQTYFATASMVKLTKVINRNLILNFE